MPDEFFRARATLMLEFEDRGILQVFSLIVGFLALGFVVEWLFRRATIGLQRWIVHVPLNTVGQRLRAAGIRLCFGLGLVIAFAIGSNGAFLAFTWPPLLREIVLGYLTAFLVLAHRAGLRPLPARAGRRALPPGADEHAGGLVLVQPHLHRRRLAGGRLGDGGPLGSARPHRSSSRIFIAYILGAGLCWRSASRPCWRRPRMYLASCRAAKVAQAANIGGLTNWLVNGLATVVLWLLWVASAMPTFWLAGGRGFQLAGGDPRACGVRSIIFCGPRAPPRAQGQRTQRHRGLPGARLACAC